MKEKESSSGNTQNSKGQTDLQAKITKLEEKISRYEKSGPACLFYSINRKMNEAAELLNSVDLTTVELNDPKDKTFERIKAVWGDVETLSASMQAVKKLAGIVGDDEESDVAKRPYAIQPEARQ